MLTLLELKDFKQVAKDTVAKIKSDFQNISGIFSVNCFYRYLLYEKQHFTKEYLSIQNSLCENHFGFIGWGEYFNDSFLNQTMVCMVFE